MESTLDVMARAFVESDPRLAVFDEAARRNAGFWDLGDRRVPVDEIVSIVAACDALATDDAVLLPLHELESAELTGTYLVCVPRGRSFEVAYFDYGRGETVAQGSAAFARTSPALQVRFWHPDYAPPWTPSYLAERFAYGTDDEESTAAVEGSVEPPGTGAVDPSFFEEVRLSIERERDARRRERWERYRAARGTGYLDQYGGIPRLAPAGRRVDDDGGQVCLLSLPTVATGGDGTEGDETAGDGSEGDATTETGDGDGPIDVPGTYGVYPGSEVIVDRVDDGAGFPVEATLVSIDGGVLSLSVTWSTSDDHAAAEAAFDAESTATFRVADLLNPVPFDRRRDGVDWIEGDDRKRGIVLGEASLAFEAVEGLGPRTRRLNGYQRRAVRRALGASDVFCIHGPPGTGKTRTLVALIEEAVHRGEKVLACAHSNQAVDNLLVGESTLETAERTTLHAAAMEGDLVLARAGNHSTNEVVNEYYADVEPWEANVVGATTSAAHGLRTDEFDLVVVDEAAQCGIASTAIPFAKGRRLVLAGDHKQLPPFTSTEADDEERMAVSLFEHVLDTYGGEASTLLRKQYRMNERIAAFPNEFFYDSLLTHGQRNRDWTLRDLDPLVGVALDGTEERTPAGSYYNEREAAAVAREVERLSDRGVPASDIGVITPYSGQVGKVVGALPEALRDRVQVSTVDAFQGSERDAIVVSFVRSNPDGETGFLTFPTEGPRRLNVSLTRARKRCTLIGNWETLRTTPSRLDPGEDASHVFGALHDHLVDRGVLREPAVEAR